MTKEEKIKAWLIEQVESYAGEFIGIQTKHGTVFIPQDRLQDDKPEPKDKALQEYVQWLIRCSGSSDWIVALQEINERLKALEAANEKA